MSDNPSSADADRNSKRPLEEVSDLSDSEDLARLSREPSGNNGSAFSDDGSTDHKAKRQAVEHVSSNHLDESTTGPDTLSERHTVPPADSEDSHHDDAFSGSYAVAANSHLSVEEQQAAVNAEEEATRPTTMRAIISMKEAGMIIGKNGKNVADIRDASGARVTVSDNVVGAVERIVTIVGPLDTVAKAFALCATKIVEEMPNPSIEDVKQRPLSIRVLVPHQRMGSVIGKQGSKIKEIQDASGAKLQACEEMLPHSTERIVVVSGVIDSIHIATYHIGAVLQEHSERSSGSLLYKPLPGVITGQQTARGNMQNQAMSASNRLPQQLHQQQQPQTAASVAQQQAIYNQMAGAYYGMAQLPAGYGYPMQQMAAAGGVPGAGPMTPMMPHGALSVQQIYIPNEMVGAIIGKGGAKINEIRARTGCNIKIADPVHGATERLITLEDTRHQLATQLSQQSSVEVRQEGEANDVRISWDRKQQLNALIDKLTATKKMIMFQQEEREREANFKSKVREKRAAFAVRLARLDKRHLQERTELAQSQQRLSETVCRIRAIELKSVKDKNQARRMKREYEIQVQQTNMRQQKDSEFLRENQLCKARQMAELNDMEIIHMEELEEMFIQQRFEEFDLIEKQNAAEAEMALNFERQKFKLEAGALSEQQKSIKATLARNQKKQAVVLAKMQRAAMRGREKMLLSEHPIIAGNNTIEQTEEESEINTDSNGSSSNAGGSTSSLNEESASKDKDKSVLETEKNSAMNKATQVLSESEREVVLLSESANERLKNLTMHHKRILAELKQQHRAQTSQKTKEHRRKIADLLKDHEEEIEQIKIEQAAIMQGEIETVDWQVVNFRAELLQTHLESEETRADTGITQNLLGMMLPGHIMEQIENGVVPTPESFTCVTDDGTDIFEFKKLVGVVEPVKILHLLNVLYTKFDDIIAKYTHLYKVESVSDTYMVAAGIDSSHDKTEQEVTECTIQALACAIELQKMVETTDFTPIVGPYPIKLRIGIHSGPINAGLIGTKMSRYCLFGDVINTASRMCTTGESGKIQVSMQVIQNIGTDDQFEFDERGEVEVKLFHYQKTFAIAASKNMSGQAETKFNQSQAVNRCRTVKESKLSAQLAICEHFEEEATIHITNLNQNFHQLGLQLQTQAMMRTNAQSELQLMTTACTRKSQIASLIDKVAGLRASLRFQRETRDRHEAFAETILHKRVANKDRLARLEIKHAAERSELAESQIRMKETAEQIRLIELKSIKNKLQLCRLVRENEIRKQHESVMHQKEIDFLRDLQIYKCSQINELNELECENMEEIEELNLAHRLQEHDLLTRIAESERQLDLAIQTQQTEYISDQLRDKHAKSQTAMDRAYKKQMLLLEKSNARAMKSREMMLIKDHPRISSKKKDEFTAEDGISDVVSEPESIWSLDGDQTIVAETNAVVDSNEQSETEKITRANMAVYADSGMNRISTSANDRRLTLNERNQQLWRELKAMQENEIKQKLQEHEKALFEFRKHQEEQYDMIKTGHNQARKELLSLHDMSLSENISSSELTISDEIPVHLYSRITEDNLSESFNAVVLIYAGTVIVPVELLKAQSPGDLFGGILTYRKTFETIVEKFSHVIKMDTPPEIFLAVAGISAKTEKTDSELKELTRKALECCLQMKNAASSLENGLEFKFGIHTGPVIGALVGNKRKKFQLFGSGLNTAMAVCRTSSGWKIQLTSGVILALGEDERFVFEESGTLDVPGGGEQKLFWLLQ
ncbi:hypothetical protein HDU82_008385 [Entophlyctis luteolus]|nr:hypothetical protein HDU82_008385 [Entophlyctis luteolus]